MRKTREHPFHVRQLYVDLQTLEENSYVPKAVSTFRGKLFFYPTITNINMDFAKEFWSYDLKWTLVRGDKDV